MHPSAADRAWYRGIAIVVLLAVLSACSAATTPQPSASLPAATAEPSAPSTEPSDIASPSPNATADPAPVLELSEIAVVIADEPLVLRSAAGTGADSAILEQRLHPGMTVRLLAGPVTASGYEWYRIATGSAEGWVAAGRLVGTVHEPWLAMVANGVIAYGGDAEPAGGVPQIFTVDAEGSGGTQLTNLTPADLEVLTSRATGNVLAVTCGTSVDPMEWAPAGGALAFAVGGCEKSVRVIQADGSGSRRVTDGGWVTWSPDGSRLAGSLNVPYMPMACVDHGPWDLWTIHLANGQHSTVTRSEQCIIASSPDWSPDGRLIAFTATDATDEEGPTAASWVVELATGRERRATYGWQPTWSPDGSRLLVERIVDTNGADPGCGECTGQVFSASLSSGEEIAYGAGYGAAWSPGGDYVAFHRPGPTNEMHEVVLVRADGSGERVLPLAGIFRGWSPDGRHVLVSDDRELWRYPLDGGAPVFLADDVAGAVAWQPIITLLTGTD